MSTPAAQDTFSRFMVEAFDERQVIAVPTAFQAFFGRPENGGKTVYSPDANSIQIDIIRANEKTAALIPRGTISRKIGPTQKNLNSEKYTTAARSYPLAEEEGDITADQTINRKAGESPFEMRSRLNRMRQLAIGHHQESIRRLVRLFERLARQSIMDGVQDAILGTSNPELQYDFYRNPANTITVANAWNSGSQDILGDIDAICEQGRNNGKVNFNFMGLGEDAMDAFIKDSTVKEVADNRRFELIDINSGLSAPSEFARFIEAGWNPRGRLRTPKGYLLWIFTYTDSFDDENGNPVKYLPVDQAVFANTRARMDRYFGPSEVFDMFSARRNFYMDVFGFDISNLSVPANIRNPGSIVEPQMFYADAYGSNDYKKITIRTQAAPIFATTHTDAIGVLKGLII